MHKILLALFWMALGSLLLAAAAGVRYLGEKGVDVATWMMRLSVSYLSDEERLRVAREMSPAAQEATRIRHPREYTVTHRG